VLGVGLAIAAVGGISAIAYLLSRIQSVRPAGGAPPPAYQQQAAGELEPEPPDAEVQNPQEGAANVSEAIDAQEKANTNLGADRRRHFTDDDTEAQPPGTDYVSDNDVSGVADWLTMASGYLDEEDPEYQGPPIY
jgi:hypothetical protein